MCYVLCYGSVSPPLHSFSLLSLFCVAGSSDDLRGLGSVKEIEQKRTEIMEELAAIQRESHVSLFSPVANLEVK